MTTLAQAIGNLPQGVYSDSFLRLLAFVMPHEVVFQEHHDGDYDFVQTEHDPHDPGGTTRYGIDQETYPEVDIEHLTFEGATMLYYNHVWVPTRAKDLGDDTALALCDAVINCGQSRSVKWLQDCLNFQGDAVDGNIGNQTVDAAQHQDDYTLAHALNQRRMTYYTTEVRASLRALYLKGWENRVADLNEYLSSNPDTSNIA